MARMLSPFVRAEKGAELGAVTLHVRVPPVGVRLVRPRVVQLLVIRAREALVVSDHVADPDAEPADEPGRELERRAELRVVAEDLSVGCAHVLDPDRDVVEPDGVPAHHAETDELIDRAVAVDDEMGTVAW